MAYKKFVHLHTHSHYSLLDGLAKIPQLIKKAVEYEMPAIALTDHGNMYGTIQFYKKCKAAGIKPILGIECYVAFETLDQKRPGIDNKIYHLVLLAKNETGYKNLIKLITTAHLDGFYYRPRIDKRILREHSEGLIGLSACLAGELSRLVKHQKPEEAEKAAKEYEGILGKGNFYIEIGHHPNIEEYNMVRNGLVEISRKTGIPLVATQDVHYLNAEDAEAQDVLVAIQTNANLNDTNRLTAVGENYSLRSAEEMWELMGKDYPEALENTIKIAEECNVEIKLGKWLFPTVQLPEGKTAEQHLTDMTREGLKKKFPNDGEEIEKRMEYELDVIIKKGYAPYFIVVGDIINFARSKGIITNTRGSAAGSLVSYLIGITTVDPIKYFLPFERFLNPFRPSPPDIDMDFADNRREEIVEYIKEKYGKDHVAQIGTFGTMMARAAVRDVARALGYQYSVGDQIAKLIPLGAQGSPMTIDKAMDLTPELKELYKKDADSKKVMDLAKKLEGCARHISVHAAGTVISPTPLTDFVPLQREPNGDKIITQYDMHAVEDAGLLKMDLLGIRNLSILGNAVRIVSKIHGIDIDLDTLPLDDKKTYEMLARGETIGVFQLNGSGMTRWLKELKPTKITDIIAMIALFRPGPMVSIPSFIKRKHGKERITYADPRLEKILESTYGIVTYQDDVLFIALELAGYNWDTVDKFRKAIGKKIPEEMAKQEKIFKEGCVNVGGLTQAKAEELWQLFEPFKGYGFNKAHAASYGMVAYQTAYMKANYPAEFMTAVLSADAGDTEKIAETIAECKRMDLPVLPPDINESFGDFTVINIGEKKGIRFGLYTIKNLGEEISRIIIEERKNNGKFESLSNFLERIHHRNLNKKSLEALIKSGAMDAFGERGLMIANMEGALEYNKETASVAQSQNSLFGLMEDKQTLPGLKFTDAPPALLEEKLAWEKELLGLYVSGHPLEKFKDKLAKLKTDIGGAKKMADNMPIILGGFIEEVRKIMTKKNDPMVFAKLSDYNNSIEVVIFPRTLSAYADIVKEGNCIGVKGKISLRNGEPSVIAEEMKLMTP